MGVTANRSTIFMLNVAKLLIFFHLTKTYGFFYCQLIAVCQVLMHADQRLQLSD